MTDSNFTIGFIGLGLIGGSIAKGIRRVFPNYTLIGMDENPDTIKSALEDGIIDSIAVLSAQKNTHAGRGCYIGFVLRDVR